MEPRPIERGNPGRVARLAVPRLASMEPRPIERGNQLLRIQLQIRGCHASMEPRPIERGNGESGQRLRYGAYASMEPRPIERGNGKLDKKAQRTFTSFNGATPNRAWKRCLPSRASLSLSVLQWSHAQSSVETRATRAIDPAGLPLQWSHAQSSVETGYGSRDLLRIELASMEPRPIERGNTRRPRSGAAPCPRFNGATPNRAWKRRCTPITFSRSTLASMEPRPIERGNRAKNVATDLQERLQWSHAQSSVETRASLFNLTAKKSASMEPRPIERGNDGARALPIAPHIASMEPRPIERGNSAERKRGHHNIYSGACERCGRRYRVEREKKCWQVS